MSRMGKAEEGQGSGEFGVGNEPKHKAGFARRALRMAAASSPEGDNQGYFPKPAGALANGDERSA